RAARSRSPATPTRRRSGPASMSVAAVAVRIRVPRPLDLEQLDVEHEHALRAIGLTLVREVIRNPEPVPIADRHERDAVGPARDHAAQAELRGLAADHRRVE